MSDSTFHIFLKERWQKDINLDLLLFGSTLPSCFLRLCRGAALRSQVAAAQGPMSSVALGPGLRGDTTPESMGYMERGGWRDQKWAEGCCLQMAWMGAVALSWLGFPILLLNIFLHVVSLTDRTCNNMCECMWAARFSPATSSLPPSHISTIWGKNLICPLSWVGTWMSCVCTWVRSDVCATCRRGGSLQQVPNRCRKHTKQNYYICKTKKIN